MSESFSTNIQPQSQLTTPLVNPQQPVPSAQPAQTQTQTQQIQQETQPVQPQQVTAETYLNQLPQNGQQTSAEQTTNTYAQTQNLPTPNTNQQTKTLPTKKLVPNLYEEKPAQYTKLPPRPYPMPEIIIEEKEPTGIKSDKAAIITGCVASFVCILTHLLCKKSPKPKTNFWQKLKALIPTKIPGAELFKKITNWSRQHIF